MEPFYFKKYDETIGTACDINDLKKEIERLKAENPLSVEYHLREGHIVQWLNYIGEKKVASELTGVNDIDGALKILEQAGVHKRKPGGMGRNPRGMKNKMGAKPGFQ